METGSTYTLSARLYHPKRVPGAGSQGELSQPRVPIWLESIRERCSVLAMLPTNWDTYGAPPIPVATIQAAVGLLSRIVGPGLPAPEVFPTPKGGLQFEWKVGRKAFEVEILAPGRVAALFVDEGAGSEWEDEFNSDLTRVVQTLASLVPAP